MQVDPQTTYVLLGAGGRAEALEGGAAFWAAPGVADGNWLFAEFAFDADWASWEMHPLGDEIVYLLDGEVTLLLELDGGVREVLLKDRSAVVVPRGVWHTAKVHAPSRMLHITCGEGTQHRPR